METSAAANPDTGPQPRTRPLEETPEFAARAADLLRTPVAIAQMSAEEARQVAAYMRLVRFAAGTAVFQAGSRAGAGFMLLLLEGQMSVDTGAPTTPGAVPISVIDTGNIVGEMSLLDGSPHSATCTAVGPVVAAGLSRGGLERLIEERPKVAAKLMVSISQRIAERLRGMSAQLELYGQLTAALEADLAKLRAKP